MSVFNDPAAVLVDGDVLFPGKHIRSNRYQFQRDRNAAHFPLYILFGVSYMLPGSEIPRHTAQAFVAYSSDTTPHGWRLQTARPHPTITIRQPLSHPHPPDS